MRAILSLLLATLATSVALVTSAPAHAGWSWNGSVRPHDCSGWGGSWSTGAQITLNDHAYLECQGYGGWELRFTGGCAIDCMKREARFRGLLGRAVAARG